MRQVLSGVAARAPTGVTRSPWDREYMLAADRYVLGTAPSALALELAAMLPPAARVLELGCGEGRDSVFFATRGFEVSGLDTSRAGLEKARRLAAERGVEVRWIQATLPEVPASGPFDLVYSCGSLHYVARRHRRGLFGRLRRVTQRGGLHAHIVFTDRIVYAEHGEVVAYFATGELRSYYADGPIVRCAQGEIACAGDGIEHIHSVEVLVARPLPRAGRPTAN